MSNLPTEVPIVKDQYTALLSVRNNGYASHILDRSGANRAEHGCRSAFRGARHARRVCNARWRSKAAGVPVHFGDTRGAIRTPGVDLGQHTEEVPRQFGLLPT